MNSLDKEVYVATIAIMNSRLNYYGKADIIRISLYKLILKYKDKTRDTDVDLNGVSFKRKLDLLLKRIEVDCLDIIRK
jgi:hypothetical protein